MMAGQESPHEPAFDVLLAASLKGDEKQVSTLILQGVNLNQRTPDGWSALIYAAKEGHLEVVQLLLKNGAEPNPTDNISHTALRGASLFGHEEVVQALLEAKANPNHTSSESKTPLHGACMNGHGLTARILLDAGADRTLKNAFGETAADLAEAKGHDDCLHWLNQAPRSPTARLLQRARTSFSDTRKVSVDVVNRSVKHTAMLAGKASESASVAKDRLRQKTFIARDKVLETAGAAQDKFRETAEAAQDRLRQKQEVSAALLLLLTVAAVLLIVLVLYFLVIRGLKLLARVQLIYFYSRSTKLDDFRSWTMEVCMDPWHRETALCQAVEGNWLAQQLVLVKLHESGADHCDPDQVIGGCQHEPCASKGLSKVLLGLADSWSSPINNRLHPIHYALLPVQKRLKKLLRALARGKLPMSKLDKELQNFPLLDRSLPFSRSGRSTRDILMEDLVYPIIREWGVIIGGSHARAPKPGSCPHTLDQVFGSLVNKEEEEEEYSDNELLAVAVKRTMAKYVGWIGGLVQSFAEDQQGKDEDARGGAYVPLVL